MNGLSFLFRPASRRARRCFTLVELLVAVSIIAVLAALAIPGLKGAIQRSRATKCASNLRQIGIAGMNFAADHDGKIVAAYLSGEVGGTDTNSWAGQLSPYLGSPMVNTNGYNRYPVFICPAYPTRFGYGHNYAYLSFAPNAGGRWVAQSAVTHPAQTVFVVDSWMPSNTNKWRTFVRPPSMAQDVTPLFSHPGHAANVLWMDGHVTSETTNTPFTKNDLLWDLN